MITVRVGRTLYCDGDDAQNTSYIVLEGKFLLHQYNIGAIGTVKVGDSLGEEGILENKEISGSLNPKSG
jgi:CRP-like cAMP-binding protein